MTVPMIYPGRANARHTDPTTSHEAADSITETGSAASAREVVRILREYGPSTDEGIAFVHHESTGVFSESRLRTARHELVEAGVVVEAGGGLTRKNRKCKRWALADGSTS